MAALSPLLALVLNLLLYASHTVSVVNHTISGISSGGSFAVS